MKNLLIIGAGQYGQVVKETAEEMRVFSKIDFLDDNSNIAIDKISSLEQFTTQYQFCFVAIGNPQKRKEIIDDIAKLNVNLATIIHPKATVMRSSVLEEGVIVEANAVVNSNSKIGQGSFICAGAVVNHNCIVGDYCQIDCNATIPANSNVPDSTKVNLSQVFKKI